MNCYEREIRLLRKFIFDHTKIEKEENMTSECDKRKLISDRMVVKLRNGTKLMVFEESTGFLFVDISGNGFDHCHLFFWDKDLKWIGRRYDHNPDYDIVKMYKPVKDDAIEDRLYFNDECGNYECDNGSPVVVKLRNGTKLMVFEESTGFLFVDISGNGFDHCHLFFWDKDLKWIGRGFNFVYKPEPNPDYDIVKIYKPDNNYTIEDRLFFNDECGNYECDNGSPVIDYKWCWERSEIKPKEMTMAEIEEELGYPVKIVKKHKCNYYQSQEQLVGVGDTISFDKGCPGR